MKKIVRHLNPPTKCDICHSQVGDEFFDAKTINGPWANMCTECFNTIGVGLGTGLGQMYKKQEDSSYIKVAG